MYFNTKSYLKSTHNYTATHARNYINWTHTKGNHNQKALLLYLLLIITIGWWRLVISHLTSSPIMLLCKYRLWANSLALFFFTIAHSLFFPRLFVIPLPKSVLVIIIFFNKNQTKLKKKMYHYNFIFNTNQRSWFF